MKLVVGLGNLGKEYDKTRHNVGFYFLDNYLENVNWKKDKFGDLYKENNILYLKPNTFMNLSGIAIRYYMSYYKIEIKDVLIIYDDIYIPLGEFKIKVNSSSGGHNGVQSIINSLKTDEFARIKIGILSSIDRDKKNYVLGSFSKIEQEKLNELKDTVNEIIKDFINDKTVDYLMNKYN